MMSNTSVGSSTSSMLKQDEGSTAAAETETETENASSPPLALVAFVGVLVFYLYLSTHYTPKECTILNLKILMLVLPVFLFLFMRSNYAPLYSFRIPRPPSDSFYRPAASPWGVALILLLLFLMLSYHPSLSSY